MSSTTTVQSPSTILTQHPTLPARAGKCVLGLSTLPQIAEIQNAQVAWALPHKALTNGRIKLSIMRDFSVSIRVNWKSVLFSTVYWECYRQVSAVKQAMLHQSFEVPSIRRAKCYDNCWWSSHACEAWMSEDLALCKTPHDRWVILNEIIMKMPETGCLKPVLHLTDIAKIIRSQWHTSSAAHCLAYMITPK